MTIPFRPVARSASGSTAARRRTWRAARAAAVDYRAPRPPGPRDPPGGVVRIGKIRNGPFLILPIHDMPPGRVVLRGDRGRVGGSSSSPSASEPADGCAPAGRPSRGSPAPERRGWSCPANPYLPPGNRACGRPYARRQSRNPCLPFSHYPAPGSPGSPRPPGRARRGTGGLNERCFPFGNRPFPIFAPGDRACERPGMTRRSRKRPSPQGQRRARGALPAGSAARRERRRLCTRRAPYSWLTGA